MKLDFFALLYIIAWIYGGMAIFREARGQGNMIRLMAIIAILIGPFGMLLYLGVRYIGYSAMAGSFIRGPNAIQRYHQSDPANRK